MIKIAPIFFRFFTPILFLAVLESYPKIIRRCAFDIGSGEHKMQVAEVDTNTNRLVRILAHSVKNVGLANDYMKNGDLSLAIQDLSKQAFRELLQEAVELGAIEFGGIATAVFRNAPSGSKLLEDLKDEAEKLLNKRINLKVVTQALEGETGYLTAVVLSPEFPKEMIVSWDSGNSSFQIVTSENDTLNIFEGRAGTAIVSRDLIEKVRKVAFTEADPINPISPQELQELIKYLTTNFNFPSHLREKIATPETKVIAIGGQTSIFSLGAQATGKDIFTAQELFTVLSSYCERLLDNSSQELHELDFSSPATTLVRLILLYSVMDALQIPEVIYKKSMGNTAGIMISPDFWV